MLEKNFFRIFKRPRKPELTAQYAQLSPKAQRLLELLRERARNNEVQISQSELAQLTGWHRTTVWRHLQEAQDAGVISWERRRRAVNTYRLLDVATVRHQASQGHSRPPPAERPSQGVKMPPGGIPGREEELAEIERLASKGANTLILGLRGNG